MFDLVVFVDGGRLSFMTIHALVQVPMGVTNIPCITQVTFKLIHNAMLANNSGL